MRFLLTFSSCGKAAASSPVERVMLLDDFNIRIRLVQKKCNVDESAAQPCILSFVLHNGDDDHASCKVGIYNSIYGGLVSTYFIYRYLFIIDEGYKNMIYFPHGNF